MPPGLRQADGNPAAPPYTKGPYVWDQILFWKAQGGANAVNALLMGIGTSASPATTSTASKFFMEFRCQSTATSGDNRLLYMRYELNGTGGGDCLRAFTKLTATVGTARGAHISLDISSTGSASGLGIGFDGQLLVFNGALTGGTYAALSSEIFSAGSSTDVSGVTEISFFRFANAGDATGRATVDTDAFLLSIQGMTAGTGSLIELGTGMGTVTGTMKIKIGSDIRFIPFYSAAG